MADKDQHDNTNKPPPASQPTKVTKQDLTQIFETLNAVSDKVDHFQNSTSDLINKVNNHIDVLERDIADDSHSTTPAVTSTNNLLSMFTGTLSTASLSASTNVTTALTSSPTTTPFISSLTGKCFLQHDSDDNLKPKNKNSPIKGWGGLSKMSNKMSKMSIIELSRSGQDLFDFSGLTWAHPLTHPSTHR